ncbi:hypothetical protein BVU76_13215 [Mycolicibacterium porcinum]|nr:hypothetical protein BVU76_13215 [Mycolicibacterium porcinum]
MRMGCGRSRRVISKVDAVQAKIWLDGLPGGGLSDELQRRWEEFDLNDKPVVTVYGAYDTGKSSLLRRVIIDGGGEVPAWLTISARHETFEVGQIEAAGCVLRDTPGFVVGGADARSDHNTQLATESIALTDVAIVTVTPQLATAEHVVLRDLVQQHWPDRSLWFVITRFDEAGIDPESDIDGYRDLACRKTAELRRALDLDDSIPVFVVAQDFAQMAGADRNPAPALWDESREWDGMAELGSALSALAEAGIQTLRKAASQRFWAQFVSSAMARLRAEAEEYSSHAQFTDDGLKQRESWLAQLDDLKRAAESDLRVKTCELIEYAIEAEAVDGLGQDLSNTVELWFSRQQRDVDKFLQSVSATRSVEQERPSWRALHDLAATVRMDEPQAADEQDFEPRVAPLVERIAPQIIAALIAYDKAGRRGKIPATPSPIANVAAAATNILPVVIELTGMAERIARERAAAAAEKQRVLGNLRSELERLADETYVVADGAMDSLIESARAAVTAATAEQVGMHDGLHQLLVDLNRHISAGEMFFGSERAVRT